MVAEPASHFNASLRKGNKLVLDHGFSESVLSNCTADPIVHLYDSWMLPMLGKFIQKSTECGLDASGWSWSFTMS